MILFDRLLVGGLRFVLDSVASAVDAELDNEDSLREALLRAEMQRELGEIGDEDFASLERDILERLRAIQERRLGGAAPGGRVLSGSVAVEVEIEGEPGRER